MKRLHTNAPPFGLRPAAGGPVRLRQRHLLWLGSLAALVGAYSIASNLAQRPDVLPPTQDIAETFAALVTGEVRHPALLEAADQRAAHSSEQIDTLVQDHITLQTSL